MHAVSAEVRQRHQILWNWRTLFPLTHSWDYVCTSVFNFHLPIKTKALMKEWQALLP